MRQAVALFLALGCSANATELPTPSDGAQAGWGGAGGSAGGTAGSAGDAAGTSSGASGAGAEAGGVGGDKVTAGVGGSSAGASGTGHEVGGSGSDTGAAGPGVAGSAESGASGSLGVAGVGGSAVSGSGGAGGAGGSGTGGTAPPEPCAFEGEILWSHGASASFSVVGNNDTYFHRLGVSFGSGVCADAEHGGDLASIELADKQTGDFEVPLVDLCLSEPGGVFGLDPLNRNGSPGIPRPDTSTWTLTGICLRVAVNQWFSTVANVEETWELWGHP